MRRLGVSSARAVLLSTARAGSQLGSTQRVTGPKAKAEAKKSPDLVAVKLHGDWCGKCKNMGPIVKDLTRKLGPISNALLITMDPTNENTKRQSGLLMSMFGLGSIYEEHQSTGKIIVVNPKTKKVVKTLTADVKAGEMADAVKTEERSLHTKVRAGKREKIERLTRPREGSSKR